MISLKYVKLLLTYRCSSACPHCIFNCSPRAEGLMDVKRFAGCWEEISESCPPDIFEVQGGEPMLYLDRVCLMVELARSGGAQERWVTTLPRDQNLSAAEIP